MRRLSRSKYAGIAKAFGPIVALNNVSFTLRRGEIHALVGHSGADKSTRGSLRMELDAAAILHQFDAVGRQISVYEGPGRAQAANDPGRSVADSLVDRQPTPSERRPTNE